MRTTQVENTILGHSMRVLWCLTPWLSTAWAVHRSNYHQYLINQLDATITPRWGCAQITQVALHSERYLSGSPTFCVPISNLSCRLTSEPSGFLRQELTWSPFSTVPTVLLQTCWGGVFFFYQAFDFGYYLLAKMKTIVVVKAIAGVPIRVTVSTAEKLVCIKIEPG